jgi:hypothetical protein
MWVEIKKVEGLKAAEEWKELFEDEGIPTRILPTSGKDTERESATYLVLVPGDKEHIIEEVLRKL